MTDNRTPTLAAVLKAAIERAALSMWTMMPGKIVDWDPEIQKASVQPLTRIAVPGTEGEDLSESELVEDLPVISGVRVIFPRTKFAWIYLPVRPDTLCMLLFASRSIEKWLPVSDPGTDTYDPKDPRHHDLNDVVAIPGLYPFGMPIPDFDDWDLRIVNDSPDGGKTEIYLGGNTGDIVLIPSNFIQLGASVAAEPVLLGETLNGLLNDLAQAFVDNAATIVQTAAVPGPGVLNPAVVTALNVFISSLVNALCTKAKVT